MRLISKFLDSLKNPFILAILGNITMVYARIVYTGELYYGFLLWNLFLAAVPLVISNLLYRFNLQFGLRFCLLLSLWLLFLPNAPYIITDMVHLVHRPPVPFWYDMLLVLLSAFNGLLFGFASLSQIEDLLRKQMLKRYIELFRIAVIMAMSYGVYLGRYLRFNSWDAFIDPLTLAKQMIRSLDYGTVGFTLTFSFVTYILYKFFQSILLHRSPEVS
jgi:uncharacterized membrane protein